MNLVEAWLFWGLLITRERGWLGGTHPKKQNSLFSLSSLPQTLEQYLSISCQLLYWLLQFYCSFPVFNSVSRLVVVNLSWYCDRTGLEEESERGDWRGESERGDWAVAARVSTVFIPHGETIEPSGFTGRRHRTATNPNERGGELYCKTPSAAAVTLFFTKPARVPPCAASSLTSISSPPRSLLVVEESRDPAPSPQTLYLRAGARKATAAASSRWALPYILSSSSRTWQIDWFHICVTLIWMQGPYLKTRFMKKHKKCRALCSPVPSQCSVTLSS
jgi:hypothetical protein